MRAMDVIEIFVCLIGLYIVGLGLMMLYGISDFDVSRFTDPASLGVLALGISGINMVLTFRRYRLERMEVRKDKGLSDSA